MPLRRGDKHHYFLHGRHKSPEWKSWANMRKRCNDPNCVNYERYGGRGIKVCERWNEFANFFADMGPKPTPRHTIERKDNAGNYEPGNCKWETPERQVNNKRNNIRITFDGRTQTLADWCRELGRNWDNVWARIKVLGWDPVRAITQVERKLKPRTRKDSHVETTQ